MEIKVYPQYSSKRPEVVFHSTEAPTEEARMAMVFCEKWGMVSGDSDGEDSAGRQKFKLSSVEDVVSRATTMATTLFDEFRKRGWLLKVPTLEEAEEIASKEKRVG